MASWIAPLVLAVFLFGLNNLAVLGGLVNPPEGYVPTYMIRDADIAQYLTWLRAFQSHLLIPDYQAPWLTEPAFFNPLLWVMARASTVVGGDLIVTYHIVHFLLYVATAYALFYALRTFSETPKQACAAFLVVLCSIPLASLAILPAFIFTLGQRGVLWGIGDFVWWSSDGFFHGISGSLLVTFGTGITIASFAFLARYLTTEKKRYLGCACLCTFLSALIHPFEVVVIVGAGAVALFFRSIDAGRARYQKWHCSAYRPRSVSPLTCLGLYNTRGCKM